MGVGWRDSEQGPKLVPCELCAAEAEKQEWKLAFSEPLWVHLSGDLWT